MGARDKFKESLTCPKCGKTGTAHCSDTQFTLGRDPLFEVERIEGNFRVEQVGRRSDEVKYICLHCGGEWLR